MTDAGITSRLDPQPPDVLGQLESRLQCQLNGRVRNLQLVLHNSGLVLRGVSRTYYGKQLAQHVVMETLDLPIVANEIEVS
jgi:hypothetical protein